jgi:ABC transport system ATP-binding/permease protein
MVINNPEEAATNLSIVRNEILLLQDAADRMPFEYLGRLVPEMLTPEIIEETNAYLIYLRLIFADQAREASARKDEVYRELESRLGSNELYRFRQQHYNKNLADLVLNRHEVNTIFKTENRLIQKKDPIFLVPDSPYGRSHFYAPAKKLYRYYIDTLWFNILAIWLMIGILYLSLLLDLPRRFVSYLESLSFKLQERPLRLGF